MIVDEKNESQKPTPLEIFIHVLAWMEKIFFVLFVLWMIYKVFEYQIFFETVTTFVLALLIIYLLEKVSFHKASEKGEVVTSNKEPSNVNKLIYYFVIVPLCLIVCIFVVYSLLMFLAEIKRIFLYDPLLLAMILVVVPIVVLILNWVMSWKFWEKING